MKFRMIKDVERQGISYVSRNFGCGNNCGCQGCKEAVL